MALIVGVPREVKIRERRVGLTPRGAAALISKGLKVLVEKGAGGASDFSDEAYANAGAFLTGGEELYASAGLILKVKEPQLSEFPRLRSGQYLFCYLHLASPENRPLVDALMDQGVTALAFESLEVEGRRPLLKPMSEIAGGLASAFGTFLVGLMGKMSGTFKLPSDFSQTLDEIARVYPEPPAGAQAPYTLIWGGGTAGEKALDFCLRMGGRAALVESNAARREELRSSYAGRSAVFFAPDTLPREVLQASELLIGCVHQAGSRACRVLTEAKLEDASRDVKKVIVDIAIDQGGNFPLAEPRTYDDPVYLDPYGNLRFSVTNMPSLCGPAASKALEAAVLPYAEALALDPEKALREVPGLAGAVNASGGKILLQAAREAHGLA